MRLRKNNLFSRSALTLVELSMAMAITTIFGAAMIAGSIALQRSFMATTDYATGINDEARISDYMAMDLRRATSISSSGGVVTVTVPSLYQSNGKLNDPNVASVMGWPSYVKKKKQKNKHSLILSEGIDYTDPSTKTTLQTIKYYRQNTNFIREVNGTAKAIATDVADFNVTLSDINDIAQVQVTFSPRFRTSSNAAVAGTTLYQTVICRNTR